MTTVTILGAGAMGSALATPLSTNGVQVHLWGTTFDREIMDGLIAGKPHPGTKMRLPPDVRCFQSDHLVEALADTDQVIIAVSSAGIFNTVSQSKDLVKSRPLAFVTKGFYRQEDGKVTLMPSAIRKALGVPDSPVVAIGGPCKANEVAHGQLTASIYAGRNQDVVQQFARTITTDNYFVQKSSDEIGVEICAPFKNVYAIALGIADGFQERSGQPWHNLKSALFAQAVAEMSQITKVSGGERQTAFGLAGVGDLEVTGLSGRNKLFGARIGAGLTPAAAKAEMAQAGLTVEGISAAELGLEFARQRELQNFRLPLLYAVTKILDGHPPLQQLSKAIGK